MPASERQVASDRELSRRVFDEYLDVPGLRLTLPQASRLFSVDAVVCRGVLDRLVEDAFLRREEGVYMRADCAAISF